MMRRRRQRRRSSKRRFKTFARRVYKAVIYKAEKKQFFISSPNEGLSVQSDSDSQFILMNPINQGVGSDGRVGNKVRCRWMKIRMLLTNNTVRTQGMRLCIVRGRTSDLTVGDAPTTNLWQIWDKEKFDVIWDKTITFNANYENLTGEQAMLRSINKSIRINREVLYDSADGASIKTNPIYLFATANDTVYPSPILWFQCAFSFTDI